MPILFMALLALLVFAAIGVLLFTAGVAERRQAEKTQREQASAPAHKPTA